MMMPDKVQVCRTSSVELMRAFIAPHVPWIQERLGVPLDQTVTIEVDSNPADLVAEKLLEGIPIAAESQMRRRCWEALIQDWVLPPGLSPHITVSPKRERKPSVPPASVWDIDWQDCPVAFRLKDFANTAISIK